MRDGGFASPLLVAQLALAGLLCLATADAANVLVARARAQSSADAAALAAAAAQWTGAGEEPADAAAAVATRNGTRLDGCECPRHGSAATVVVSAATRIRMLGIAPRSVSARAEAKVDVGRLFERPG